MARDLRLDASFWDHVKTRKLIRRLGLEGPVALQRIWAYCADSGRTDGVLTNMDAEDIEMAADWQGDEGELLDALVDLRFIDDPDGGPYAVHDWATHQPWLCGAEARSKQARNAARVRHADSKRTASARHADSTADSETSNAPLPSSPLLSLPTLSKREECSEPSAATPPAPPSLMDFPVRSPKDQPQTWGLTQGKLDEYIETYGEAMDVIAELRKARQYVLDNAVKRKTPSGMARYLGGWLARANDRGGARPSTPAPAPYDKYAPENRVYPLYRAPRPGEEETA